MGIESQEVADREKLARKRSQSMSALLSGPRLDESLGTTAARAETLRQTVRDDAFGGSSLRFPRGSRGAWSSSPGAEEGSATDSPRTLGRRPEDTPQPAASTTPELPPVRPTSRPSAPRPKSAAGGVPSLPRVGGARRQA